MTTPTSGRSHSSEGKPLLGRRVIVTRAEERESRLATRLEELGAWVDAYPVIRFVPPDDCSDLDAAIGDIDSFDWILFTSANGVEWFVKRLLEMGKDAGAMARAKLGAIGPATADALRALNLSVDYVPTEHVAEGMANEFPEDPAGKSILIPRAKEAREELHSGLQARGARVTVAWTYQTVPDTSRAAELRETLSRGEVDIIAFTSASTVNSFIRLAGDASALRGAVIACIGPVTAEAVRSHGLCPAIVAERYTIDGLVDAIAAHSARL